MNTEELLAYVDRDRNVELYGGSVKVRFMPKAHRYKVEGIELWAPSVTSISGSADKSAYLIPWALKCMASYLLKWNETALEITRDELAVKINEGTKESDRVRDEAAMFGSIVHAYAEIFAEAMMKGEAPPAPPEDAPDAAVLGIKAFTDWVAANPTLKFIAAERIVASRDHAFVGQLDAIVEIDGKRWLVDYKTSKGIYDEAIIQTAGYLFATREESGEKIDGRLILHFDKETGTVSTLFLEGEDDENADFIAFLAYLTAKRRMKILEDRRKKREKELIAKVPDSAGVTQTEDATV